MKRLLVTFFVGLCCVIGGVAPSHGVGLIRDTEIEAIIQGYAEKIAHQTSINPKSMRIFIVSSNEINAFTAGGQNVFLNAGLIKKCKDPSYLLGVMAHEMGHIAGGHVVRGHGAMENLSQVALVGMIAGMAAAVVSGHPGPGMVAGMGVSGAAMGSFLRYRRSEESTADAFALKILRKLEVSPEGLKEFFHILEHQERMTGMYGSPYLRTHPDPASRAREIAQEIKASPYSGKPAPEEFQKSFGRMIAKLKGYTDSPMLTLRAYKEDDPSFEARYARALAYYRLSDLTKAIPLMDGLLKEHPNDAFLYETKGQMLFEHQRPQEALAAYQKAAKAMPKAPLIQVALAQVELSAGNRFLDSAEKRLAQAIASDKEIELAWHFYAIALGRKKDFGRASWALAEKSLLVGDYMESLKQVARAKKNLTDHSVDYLRVVDIEREAKYLQSKRRPDSVF